MAVRLEEPGGDDIHLRDVLEAQPVTLIRLGCDGRVLAINDAGRAVIGAERLEQILETSFTDVLQEGEHSGFLAFLEHVAAGHRGSLELSLTAFTGNRFTMRLHATPHPGSPDGIKSVLVTLLDITESRRLEQSLVEAMARQTDQEAAHEAERERLSADLRAAELERATALERHAKDLDALTEAFEHRQQVSDEQASRLERLADLEPRFTELSERYNATEAAVGTLTDELEKSRLEADAARAHAQELDQRRQNAESTLAALTQEAAQRREDAEAVRTGLEQELEAGRRLLETANLETARHQADIAALREALETSMNTHAQAAARSKLEADIVAARLTVLETALAAAHSARGAAIARARQLSQETQRIARQFISQVAGADAELGTTTSELGAQLEAAITTAVDGRLSVTMMVAAPERAERNTVAGRAAGPRCAGDEQELSGCEWSDRHRDRAGRYR